MSLALLAFEFTGLLEMVWKSFCKPRRRALRLARVPVEDLEIRCFLSATAGLVTIIQPDGRMVSAVPVDDLSSVNDSFAIKHQDPDWMPHTAAHGSGNHATVVSADDAAALDSLFSEGGPK